MIEAVFPEVGASATTVDAAQSQNIFRSRLGPEHPRLFAPCADDRFAARFDHPRTNEITLGSEGAILHPLHVTLKIAQRFSDCLGLGLVGTSLAGFFNQRHRFL
jgi:hypothetical protein